MKKLNILLFVILFAKTIIAQPIITATEGNPQVGEIFTTVNTDLEMGDQGNAGANVTWDFSNITTITGSNATIEYVDPASTGYGTDFPDANRAYLADSLAESWQMLKTDSTGLYMTGNTYYLYNITPSYFITTTYSDLLQIYFLPATYGDVQTDTFVATSDADGTVFTSFSGIRTIEVDAYGDLILPDVTIENVLRLKIVQESLEEPPFSTTTVYESYKWFKEGIPHPILVINRRVVGGNPPRISSTLLTDTEVGIFDTPTIYDAVNVFPNPTTSFTTLSIELEETKQVSISVMDILGRDLMSVTNQKLSAGEHDFTIDLSAFTKGVYLIKSEIGDAINTQKVIVK